MHGAALRMRMVDADERFVRTVGEQGYRAILLVSNDAEIAPFFVDWPFFDPSKPVRRHQLGRINEM